MNTGIPFPNIGPEIFSFELFGLHLALRWYAMGYIIGIIIGWWIIRRAIGALKLWRDDGPPLDRAQLEDLITWLVVGIILGGRLGYVLFYGGAYYWENPAEILKVWTGGMSFHGGFLGVIAAVWLFSKRHGLRVASVADLLAIATPPALFLVRGANFINAELWGRPTEFPLGVIFPTEAAQFCPGFASPCARHPSQLYEALLEGALLGILLLTLAYKRGWLKKPGQLTGLFFAGYGVSRFIVEFFRQADAQFITPENPWGHVVGLGQAGVTMGQLLSLPMIAIGIAVIIWARRRA